MSKSSAPSQATLADPEVLQAKSSPTRDDDLWFDDGTLIVVAQNVEFRVYRNHLAERFEVFRDMLSFPQPTPSDSTDDLPCPAIHVTDSARDWRNVLRLLMPNSRSFALIAAKTLTFDAVSACIRLGKKYQMTELYSECVQFLRNHYTTDFDRWTGHAYWAPPSFSDLHAIGVVNLARLTGEASILPTALLACTLLRSDILRGFTRADGTQEILGAEDLARCFDAKERVVEVTIAARLRTFHPEVSAQCKSGPRCRVALCSALRMLEQKISSRQAAEEPRRVGDPLGPATSVCSYDQLGLCTACEDMVRVRDLQAHKELWNRLPEIVGVEVAGWPRAVRAEEEEEEEIGGTG
ncbi:hypothetical protein K466DRAFT_598906 [Polyporus arcularius HHB13444]|uniref:BTB domain-containing protein n=1 Tax=Polyporus arcularius HHB13444 TaxID=1314778 RepID=A0A5C3PFP7_9APHY|nr:hypothetical protein K466DRAFT_598906 [Polyporus arcularius HHB13444]